MNTFSHPVKKNNFEVSELKAKNKKSQKSERRESKKMIDKMISEDQEIEQSLLNKDWDDEEYDRYTQACISNNLEKYYEPLIIINA